MIEEIKSMKNLLVMTLLVMVSFFAFSSQKSKKVAIVKIVRGQATILAPDGVKSKIKKGMWLKEGTIVKTSAKSFVRLSFIDKSSMNVGPKSELKIEKFSKNEAGVINVLTGKIRSQVTKDYLNMDKSKSKLFIKSRNAVMGVRGTDFLFSANKRTGTATTVLFEGSIVFNKISKGDNIRNLEAIVNKGRSIKPGEVSVTTRSRAKPTVPAKMSSKQFSKLNKNSTFKISDIKNVKKQKSVVPPGLSGSVVAGDNKNLKDEIKKIVKVNIKDKIKKDDKNEHFVDSKGCSKGDDVRPPDGILVHIDTGTLIPPGLDSSFDQNAGEWVSSSNGGSSASGEYVPPQGFQINDEGQLLKMDENTGEIKSVVVIDMKPVDQMPPLDQAPTREYIAPKEEFKGPAPAGTMNEIQNEFDRNHEEVINEEIKIETQLEKEYQDYIDRNPDGDFAHIDEGYLPPPPRPEDCSTCDQPNSLFNNTGTHTAPPPGKTKVNVHINKQ
jgi:hypothetical protein